MTKEDPVESEEMEKQAHCKAKGSVEEKVPPARGEVASERKCTMSIGEHVGGSLFPGSDPRSGFSWHVTIKHHKPSSSNATPDLLQVPKLEMQPRLTWFRAESHVEAIKLLTGMFSSGLERLFNIHRSLGEALMPCYLARVPLLTICEFISSRSARLTVS